MEKSTYALTEHEVFVRELIALYKQKPLLWQQKHPQYRNRAERAEAYEILVKKAQEYYPEADEDFVRMKIDSMRSSFRKERKKVVQSKENSSNPDEVHRPSLWYYELLLFTAGEEAENEVGMQDVRVDEAATATNNPEDGNSVKIPFWSREHSAILINFYKNHQCLYSVSHPLYRNKRKRNEAVKKITDKLMAATAKYFHPEDVRRKISLIRGQFLHEYKKIKNSESKGEVYVPTLWCFEMLSFLKEEYVNNRKVNIKRTENLMNLRRKGRQKTSTSEESDDDMDIKKESDSSCSESIQMESQSIEDDDIFDTIAKNLAHKLREMTEEQRSIANKVIRDVLYHGQMEHLSKRSRFSLDGS